MTKHKRKIWYYVTDVIAGTMSTRSKRTARQAAKLAAKINTSGGCAQIDRVRIKKGEQWTLVKFFKGKNPELLAGENCLIWKELYMSRKIDELWSKINKVKSNDKT